jgi:hypothetical protein
VDRARSRLSDAENALQRTQRWFRQFDHELDPRIRSTRPLRQILDHDLVKAIALLAETINLLADYADLPPGQNATTPSATESGAGNIPPPDPESDSGPQEGAA